MEGPRRHKNEKAPNAGRGAGRGGGGGRGRQQQQRPGQGGEKKQNRYAKQDGVRVEDEEEGRRAGPNAQRNWDNVRKRPEKGESAPPRVTTLDQVKNDRENKHAARMAKMVQKAPTKPPFTANFLNLPFQATAEEFQLWLPRDVKVKDIRWREGSCHVDFESREHLLAALELEGKMFRRRAVRVLVAKPLREGRSAKYEEHMSVEEARQALEKGSLCCGQLRVNPHNRKEAYATVDGFAFDVKFLNLAAQNRALDGDDVAIRILDKSQWIKMDGEVENPADSPSSDEEDEEDSVEAEKNHVEDEEPNALQADQQAVLQESLRPVGVVVAILEKRGMRSFVGWLRPSRETEELSDKTDQAHFIPFHKRMHRVNVRLSSLPADQRRGDFYKSHLYMCEVGEWKASQSSPSGKIVRDFGPGGDLEVEKKILLESNMVDFDENFSAEVNACLPPKDYVITEAEIANRRDLRKTLVCSIDPATAKDLDDALSIERLPNGNWSVGVHIADVTHFIPPGSALDEEAKSRATSVYLVDRCIPMLPRILSERLCSLNSGQDCLAFSAIFEMNSKGDVVTEWFGKTCIRNAMQMSYEVAQSIIDGNAQDEVFKIDPTTSHTIQQVKDAIVALNELSHVMRKKRFDNGGSIQLESVKLSFQLDEQGKPVRCWPYQQKPANELVEEFMLLANKRVAMFILNRFPEGALLRKHERPGLKMKEFVALCSKFGYKIDASSSFSLNSSLAAVEDPSKPFVHSVIYHLALRAMQLAKYTHTDNEYNIQTFYWHYALAFDIYTHFTSPIRRYADCMVHRILHAAVTNAPQPATKEQIKLVEHSCGAICANCNERKTLADRASDRSDIVFLCHLLKDAPLEELEGYVYRITAKGFDVMCPKYGVEDAVMLDRVGLVKDSKFDENKLILTVTFDSYNTEYFSHQKIDEEHDKRPLSLQITMFQKVRVVCQVKDSKRELDMGVKVVITEEGL